MKPRVTDFFNGGVFIEGKKYLYRAEYGYRVDEELNFPILVKLGYRVDPPMPGGSKAHTVFRDFLTASAERLAKEDFEKKRREKNDIDSDSPDHDHNGTARSRGAGETKPRNR